MRERGDEIYGKRKEGEEVRREGEGEMKSERKWEMGNRWKGNYLKEEERREGKGKEEES